MSVTSGTFGAWSVSICHLPSPSVSSAFNPPTFNAAWGSRRGCVVLTPRTAAIHCPCPCGPAPNCTSCPSRGLGGYHITVRGTLKFENTRARDPDARAPNRIARTDAAEAPNVDASVGPRRPAANNRCAPQSRARTFALQAPGRPAASPVSNRSTQTHPRPICMKTRHDTS
ncbi:unnamed protein product, partial [Iphiclides podalirius]